MMSLRYLGPDRFVPPPRPEHFLSREPASVRVTRLLTSLPSVALGQRAQPGGAKYHPRYRPRWAASPTSISIAVVLRRRSGATPAHAIPKPAAMGSASMVPAVSWSSRSAPSGTRSRRDRRAAVGLQPRHRRSRGQSPAHLRAAGKIPSDAHWLGCRRARHASGEDR